MKEEFNLIAELNVISDEKEDCIPTTINRFATSCDLLSFRIIWIKTHQLATIRLRQLKEGML